MSLTHSISLTEETGTEPTRLHYWITDHPRNAPLCIASAQIDYWIFNSKSDAEKEAMERLLAAVELALTQALERIKTNPPCIT